MSTLHVSQAREAVIRGDATQLGRVLKENPKTLQEWEDQFPALPPLHLALLTRQSTLIDELIVHTKAWDTAATITPELAAKYDFPNKPDDSYTALGLAAKLLDLHTVNLILKRWPSSAQYPGRGTNDIPNKCTMYTPYPVLLVEGYVHTGNVEALKAGAALIAYQDPISFPILLAALASAKYDYKKQPLTGIPFKQFQTAYHTLTNQHPPLENETGKYLATWMINTQMTQHVLSK